MVAKRACRLAPWPLDLYLSVGATFLSPKFPTKNTRLHIQTDINPAPVTGDPGLLERLIRNLIDNAIRHNIPNGHVQVTTQMRGGHAVLTVTNTGPLVPAGEIDRLFEPFQRLEAGRSNGHTNGYGLGLSIIQAIATAHHAQLTAQPRSDGGLEIEVTFPASATATIPSADPAHEKPKSGPKAGHLTARSR